MWPEIIHTNEVGFTNLSFLSMVFIRYHNVTDNPKTTEMQRQMKKNEMVGQKANKYY